MKDQSRRPPADFLIEQTLEFILEAPEEEVRQFLAEEGVDQVSLEKGIRAAVAVCLKDFGRSRLAAARAEYEMRTAEVQRAGNGLNSMDDKRALFTSLLQQAHQRGLSVSMQFRELDTKDEGGLDAAIQSLIALLARNP